MRNHLSGGHEEIYVFCTVSWWQYFKGSDNLKSRPEAGKVGCFHQMCEQQRLSGGWLIETAFIKWLN